MMVTQPHIHIAVIATVSVLVMGMFWSCFMVVVVRSASIPAFGIVLHHPAINPVDSALQASHITSGLGERATWLIKQPQCLIG